MIMAPLKADAEVLSQSEEGWTEDLGRVMQLNRDGAMIQQRWEPAEKLLDGDPSLQEGDLRAKAAMRPRAEGKVIRSGVRATYAGLGEARGIAVGGAQHQGDTGAVRYG